MSNGAGQKEPILALIHVRWTELKKDRTEPLARILLAVAMLLGALAVLKVVGFFVASSKARAIAATPDPNGTGGHDLSEQMARAKTSAEQLKKKNLFILPAAKQHPIKEVLGILGDEALINDKWYKVGDRVGDAEILAIEPTRIRVAWDGQEKEFAPIGSGSGPGGPPGPRPVPSMRPGPTPDAQVVVAEPRRGSPGPRREGAPFLSAEERQKLRQRWENASAEERQRFREEMRQRSERRNR